MSRRFKYVGPFDEVEVAGQVVARGSIAEFSAEVAEGLDGQDTWKHVPDPKRVRAAKKAAKKAPAKKAGETDAPVSAESTPDVVADAIHTQEG